MEGRLQTAIVCGQLGNSGVVWNARSSSSQPQDRNIVLVSAAEDAIHLRSCVLSPRESIPA